MIPETVVAMLACARIGAPHTVVFGGFSSQALQDRILDCDARVVITADGGYRRGAASALKPAVDAALEKCPDVRNVLVVRRTGQDDIEWTEGRDLWWHEFVGGQSSEHVPEAFDAEHPLYVMYTSGTTGKPKGILHTTGGYLVGCAYTHWAVFDVKPDHDIYWTAADIGWVTGHSYIVYGPLSNGVTSVMYEGTPDSPHKGRWWELIEKYKVSILYCAPTAIRTFMKWGAEIPEKHDMSSLRLIGSVGEPINPEAYIWYRENIGGGRCPVVDTWWQTETGSIMISPLPGVTAGKPGSAMTPLPGVSAEVVDDAGNPVDKGSGGYLVLTEPWPSMLRTLWGDDDRYIETYWSRFEGKYFAGDGAKLDEDGDIWLLGRVDDVMNVAGHRLSTTEIESALVSHPKVAEAAVVGATDPTTRWGGREGGGLHPCGLAPFKRYECEDGRGLGLPGDSVECVDLAGFLALHRADVGLADLGERDRGEAREVVAVGVERLGEHRWADRVDPLRGDLDGRGANERLQSAARHRRRGAGHDRCASQDAGDQRERAVRGDPVDALADQFDLTEDLAR